MTLRRLYYCDHYPIPLPPGHKFPIEKYAMLRALLATDGGYDLTPAPFAVPTDLERAHDPTYVQSILQGTVDPRIMRRIGFPWSPELVRRTLASVGGTLAAARDAMQCGFGGNLAGGTHHAFRHEGSGFCVFNDLAVAILALRHDGLAARAAVLDLDVHQGDGTAAIFENDPAVLTISLHGEHNFPFRKQRSSIDIALPDGTADAPYLDSLGQVLREMISYNPDVIFYQAGVDALACDRLGRLELTSEGLRERDRLVREMVSGFPLVVTLGGGYGDPIEQTARAHAATFFTFLNRG
ncbi:MAG: histone deacetylase [Candidatus Solibacter sp.]